MFKIVSVIIVGLFILGCSSQNSMNVSNAMFQSVNKEDATLVQEGEKKGYCARCGMDLVKFYKTSHAATFDGKNYQYCSIHCLEEHLGEGIELKNPKVVDVASLKFIDVNKAYYVVGSSKRGTMTKVSKYAFLNEADAKKFQAEFGGEIMDFNKAREKAKEDFKHYKN
ncbi:MAG: nitrous oxide reductase accessory protein NosL [Campylobacterales bacterium]|nr:nitrous oxide reductase accessory protein NosL [Campylobacterales bacterium]